MLPEFLTSCAGAWDELVAVDTGSTDGTVGILQAAGARVLHEPWTGDFSAARNASLAAASCIARVCLSSGTSDNKLVSV